MKQLAIPISAVPRGSTHNQDLFEQETFFEQVLKHFLKNVQKKENWNHHHCEISAKNKKAKKQLLNQLLKILKIQLF